MNNLLDIVKKLESYFGIQIWNNGYKVFHRLDGPAVEHSNGDKWWYKEGRLHREDESAVELGNGYKRWFYEGKNIEVKNNEEFLRMIKLKAFW